VDRKTALKGYCRIFSLQGAEDSGQQLEPDEDGEDHVIQPQVLALSHLEALLKDKEKFDNKIKMKKLNNIQNLIE